MGERAKRIGVLLNERAPHPTKAYTALECVVIMATWAIVSLLGLLVCALRAMGVI